ncbi:MAG TPA: thioredoxin domain-containing protein [Ignavibacteria bacterium]
MKNILVVIILIFFFSINAQTEEIKFETGNFKEVLQKAKQENKLLMIDFYTDWCGWCKKLDLEVYSEKNVAEFANLNQINWKIDAEKGEGPDVTKKYDIKVFPTIIFVDGEGNEIDRIIGYRPAKEFLETMKEFNRGENTKSSLQKILNENLDDPTANFKMGMKVLKNGDADIAKGYFKQVVKSDPGNNSGFTDDAEFELAKMEQTPEKIIEFIKLNPESNCLKDAYITTANFYVDSKDIRNIKKYYEIAFDKYGKNDSVLKKSYGNALVYYCYIVSIDDESKNQNYKDALKISEEAMEYMKGNEFEADVFYVRSMLYNKLKDKKNALKEINEAIKMKPEDIYKQYKEELEK